MLTLAHATAASWLDAGSLSRLVGLNSRADVLVLGCSAAEVELFEAHRPRRIDCVSADAEDLEDAAAAATARGIVIEVHGAPPRAAYDLVPITHTITRACIYHAHAHTHAMRRCSFAAYAVLHTHATRVMHRSSSRRAICTRSRSWCPH